MPYVEVQVGDVVTLRKPHPCGHNEWAVVRIGADVGLRCAGCGRRVLLPRGEFNRRYHRHLQRPGAEEAPAP